MNKLLRTAGFRKITEYKPKCSPLLGIDRERWLNHLDDCLVRSQKIYIFKAEDTGLCKIGTSKDPRDRWQHLKTAFRSLKIVGSFRGGFLLERFLHREFSELRSFGEWFDIKENPRLRVSRAVRCFNAFGFELFKGDFNKYLEKPTKKRKERMREKRNRSI